MLVCSFIKAICVNCVCMLGNRRGCGCWYASLQQQLDAVSLHGSISCLPVENLASHNIVLLSCTLHIHLCIYQSICICAQIHQSNGTCCWCANKILAKREMQQIAQCVWTMWGWFCSETIRSHCSFSPQHQSLMDPMPPDLFQGQNLCHIIHTFKTGILQKSLWLCSANITRSHYFLLI